MGTSSGSGKGSDNFIPGGFDVTSGGAFLPFNFGPSPFDLSSISSATGDNTAAVTNRYNQLGLGGSTMEQQDLAGQKEIGQATTGQEQTQTVADPAINTSLQPSINELIGVGSAQSAAQGLTSANTGLTSLLSNLANQASQSGQFSSGAGSVLGGSGTTASDLALGSDIVGAGL